MARADVLALLLRSPPRWPLEWAGGLFRDAGRVDAASAADRSVDDITTRQVALATLLSKSEGGRSDPSSTTPKPRCDVLVALLRRCWLVVNWLSRLALRRRSDTCGGSSLLSPKMLTECTGPGCGGLASRHLAEDAGAPAAVVDI